MEAPTARGTAILAAAAAARHFPPPLAPLADPIGPLDPRPTLVFRVFLVPIRESYRVFKTHPTPFNTSPGFLMMSAAPRIEPKPVINVTNPPSFSNIFFLPSSMVPRPSSILTTLSRKNPEINVNTFIIACTIPTNFLIFAGFPIHLRTD